jgi:dynein heavy chain
LPCVHHQQIDLSAKHGLSSMSYEEAFEKRSIAWGDFLKPGLERAERQYEEVADGAKLLRLLEDYLDEYNMSHTNTMNLGALLRAAVVLGCIAKQAMLWV